MAEIVCPYCHSTVPHDGTFCPRCRCFIGSGAADAQPRVPAETVVAGGYSVAKDVVEEAVKASMATSRRGGSWDVLETGDDADGGPGPPDGKDAGGGPGPPDGKDAGGGTYPSAEEPTMRQRPAERPRTRASGSRPARERTQRAPEKPPVLARVVAWLVALPARVRTGCRALGALPVGVFVVVLALLASGGLLYAVGAFDEGTGEQAAADTPVHELEPASYKASCAAKASVTSAGNKVTFGADHLVDGKTRTGWRCEGDGSDQKVTLRFDRPVEVTKVALVPGWATKDKTSKANRFKENGAPTKVTWTFDNGSVKQRIGKPKPSWAEQALKSPVRSETVTLSIDEIREGNRRQMVAVSEIAVYGR